MAIWYYSNGSLVTIKGQSKGNYKNKRYENYEKLLGIKFDTKLNFSEHLNDIMSKVSRKINVLLGVMPYIILSKKKILATEFNIFYLTV